MIASLQEQLALLPGRLAAHLFLCLVALGAGALLTAPLSVLVLRVRRLQGPVLALAAVIQTIPALALLALMVPLLALATERHAIGRLPALLALCAYSLLPMLRNCVTGIQQVDANAVVAGIALGMTPRQLLLRVQVPLALPVMVAGVRTAAVWTVGMATLATPVGAESLGNYIFVGLQTRNHTAVVVGCAAAAALALLLDGLIRVGELAARYRSRAAAAVCLGGLLALAGWASTTLSGPAAQVRIGAKNFTEQYVLAELLAREVRRSGRSAEVLQSMGSSQVFDALLAGSIACYVDYTGTLWAEHMGRPDNPGADAVLVGVTDWLAERGVICLGRLGFANAYCIAMTSRRAELLGVGSLTDLAARSGAMVVGGDYAIFDRPEWRDVVARYGLHFQQQRVLDPGLLYDAVRTGQVDAITAYSSDGRIAAFDLRVLADPLQAFPPYDAVLLVSAAAARDAGLLAALRPLLGSIDDATMRRANMWVDVEGVAPAEAAHRIAR